MRIIPPFDKVEDSKARLRSSRKRGTLDEFTFESGESSVFVYYSGHGAPNPESGSPYFIPTDTNPSYLSQNGYPVNQLYENLSKIPAEAITVVVEACFSGTSESGSVVSDISPAVLSVENPVMGMENGIALTAGAADQVSTWYNEKRHGLFTYYFLKGLREEADANGNDAITAKEMKQYVSEEVPYRARRLHNREQNPQVVGQNLGRVLVRYGDSPPPPSRRPACQSRRPTWRRAPGRCFPCPKASKRSRPPGTPTT